MAEGKLIVVSNRLPLSVRRSPEGWIAEPSSGGLATVPVDMITALILLPALLAV